MRRFLTVLTLLAATLLPAAAAPSAQVDTTRWKEVDDRLDLYLATLEGESIPVKIQECDLLLEAASQPSLRARIAQRIYEHYRQSPLMGDEAVAIHLTDKWFAPGKAAMRDDAQLMEAKVFAEFNRQSLLGAPAPAMDLLDTLGAVVNVAPHGRLSVLYFYDTGCVKCRAESVLLRRILSEGNYPVDFYAVYTGADEASWAAWRREKWNIDAPATRFFHLWDPEVASDYQRKYGVLSTPKVFLVDGRGTIVGRNLDPPALLQLLRLHLSEPEYTYGGAESADLFDRLFAAASEDVSAAGAEKLAGEVLSVAALLEDRTLAKGDTLSFKHLEGDLLYYLASRRDEGFKQAASAFLSDYILSRGDVWRTADDSLKVVGMARWLDDLLSRTPVGTRIPRLPLPGWNAFRRRGGWLIFHTPGCGDCSAVLAAADSLSRTHRPRRRVMAVDMDELLAGSPELASRLFETFDLSMMPFVVETGRRGKVLRKYVSLIGKND